MILQAMSLLIPQPATIPFLGNVANIEKDVPLRSFNLLAEQYGPIFRLDLPSRKVVVFNSYELIAEASDDKRFPKNINGGLQQVRNAVHDGLFTAYNEEINWGIAHRILMPAFGTASIRGMFSDMEDVISQLVLKWQRFGPDYIISPTEDFTRLTLDAIALCSMSYRLNSFYLEHPHPFAQAMFEFLLESSARSNRPNIVQVFMKRAQAKYDEDIKYMSGLASSILEKRKENPVEGKDLLNLMMNGKDPKTGQGMTEESIVNNLITFLIAGHETTSGMLSFATYNLAKNPEALAKLRAEIDEVIGDQPIQLSDLGKMPYTVAVMRETLRLDPTASMRTVSAVEPTTVCNGKYAIEPDEIVLLNIYSMQRDPTVWGSDAEEFNPDRMLDGRFEALPNAWQPFGFGARGCIGRAFAWQEAHMTIATIYQKFDIVLTDPNYKLQLKQALTIKPANFYIRAIPRIQPSRPRLYAQPSSKLLNSSKDTGLSSYSSGTSLIADADKKPFYALYGSNTGTCESFAQRIAADAPSYGFRATIGTLDSAAEHLPRDGPIIIVTASFEGEPADNAAYFVKYLKNSIGDALAGVKYAVFGCGNRDWTRTYQRIPRLVDEVIKERGGVRLIDRGEGDAAGSDMFQDFDSWETSLFKCLTEEYHTTGSEAVSMISITNVDSGTARSTILRQTDAVLGEVVVNKVLTARGKPVKRHIEFKLPESQSYRSGDYLAVLPVNPAQDVNRVLSHFKLFGEQEISIHSVGPTALPTGRPISLSALLAGYVELSQPATPRNIRSLIQAQDSEQSKIPLHELESSYAEKVVAGRLSVLDILEAHPDIKLAFEAYLDMIPPMRIRQYSISSSPLWNPQHVTVTISVINAPAISGREEPFLGVASSFLNSLKPGDRVQMAIRPSAAFHLPSDPTIPIVMLCAGSGVAPMRGFIQERALQKKAGRDVGKMMLFFGCRSPQEDYLYSDSDFVEWINLGILELRPAFSRSSDESAGCKYVQDRAWADRADIVDMFDNSAKLYVCGSGKVAGGIKEKLLDIISERNSVNPVAAADTLELITKASRYATDIFE